MEPDLVNNILGATVKVYNGSVFQWVGMTTKEVAEDFEKKLASGNPYAKEFNNALWAVEEAG